MSTIPPNVVGSILQAGLMQRGVARMLEAERDQQDKATDATSRLRERSAESVGETDRDSQVHPDTEGTGGQGRHLEGETEHHDSQSHGSAESDGIRRDAEGRLHVDLQA